MSSGGPNDIATLQYLQEHPGVTATAISEGTDQALVHVERFLADIIKHDVGYMRDGVYFLGQEMSRSIEKFSSEQKDLQEQIVEALEDETDPVTLKYIADELGLTRRELRHPMRDLVRAGTVKRLPGRPRMYTLDLS